MWVNGEFIDASVPIALATDHGFQLGDGIFDTLAIRDSRPVFLDRHLQRLRRGLQQLEIIDAPSDIELREAIETLIEVDNLTTARLRITVTPGPGPSPRTRGPAPLTVITTGTLHDTPSSVSLCSVDWTRNERSPLCGIKSTSWGENAAILRFAHSRGFDNALLRDSVGRLSECATSNLFAVIEDRVLTPPLDTGCLPGVTREVLLDHDAAIEEVLLPEDLIAASEVFITSSTTGVVPVHRIDERTYRTDGPTTSTVRELLNELSRIE